MKTVVAMPARGSLDPNKVLEVLKAAGAKELYLSLAEGFKEPELPGITVTVIRHRNVPHATRGGEKIQWYVNNIIAPLAETVYRNTIDGNKVLFVHDDVQADEPVFQTLLSKVGPYKFVSATQIYSNVPGLGRISRSRPSRLVAWDSVAFGRYMSERIKAPAEVIGDSLDMVMVQMEKDGVAYLWTDLPVTHTST